MTATAPGADPRSPQRKCLICGEPLLLRSGPGRPILSCPLPKDCRKKVRQQDLRDAWNNYIAGFSDAESKDAYYCSRRFITKGRKKEYSFPPHLFSPLNYLDHFLESLPIHPVDRYQHLLTRLPELRRDISLGINTFERREEALRFLFSLGEDKSREATLLMILCAETILDAGELGVGEDAVSRICELASWIEGSWLKVGKYFHFALSLIRHSNIYRAQGNYETALQKLHLARDFLLPFRRQWKKKADHPDPETVSVALHQADLWTLRIRAVHQKCPLTKESEELKERLLDERIDTLRAEVETWREEGIYFFSCYKQSQRDSHLEAAYQSVEKGKKLSESLRPFLSPYAHLNLLRISIDLLLRMGERYKALKDLDTYTTLCQETPNAHIIHWLQKTLCSLRARPPFPAYLLPKEQDSYLPIYTSFVLPYFSLEEKLMNVHLL